MWDTDSSLGAGARRPVWQVTRAVAELVLEGWVPGDPAQAQVALPSPVRAVSRQTGLGRLKDRPALENPAQVRTLPPAAVWDLAKALPASEPQFPH